MNRSWLVLILILFLLLVTACSASVTTPSASNADLKSDASVNATTVPNPDQDMATVTGKLLAKSGEQPISSTLLRLAEIYGEGSDSFYVINDTSSPGTYTDQEGAFVFSNVKPGPYAVLLTDSQGNYVSVNETADKILTVEANANQVTDMGVVKIEYPLVPAQ